MGTWIELGWKNLEKPKAVQNVEKSWLEASPGESLWGAGGLGNVYM